MRMTVSSMAHVFRLEVELQTEFCDECNDTIQVYGREMRARAYGCGVVLAFVGSSSTLVLFERGGMRNPRMK